ncbi:MAG: oligosaccharide flippase family protein [Candidatus Peregrinibacteria bacterium]|nr:oligosaccharide flippase family protein [Candidatus Peregrinibacteria bacterium]
MIASLLRTARIPFVRDVTTMQIGRLVTIGSSFIASILYVRFLGLGGYGEYAVVLAYTGTVGLFTNLGQQATTLTFFAEAYGRKDREAQARIFHYYLVTAGGAAGLLLLLMALSPILTTWIYGRSIVGLLAGLVFLSSVFEIPFIFVSIVLQTVREIRMLTLLENAKTLLQIIVAVGLLASGVGVVGLLLSSLIASVCFSAVGIGLYAHLKSKYGLPSIPDALAAGRSTHFWRYMKDGFWIAVDKSLGNLYPNIFLFVFSTQVSAAVIGLLRLGMKLAELPSSFVLSGISRLASSAVPVMIGKGKTALRASLVKLIKHTAALHFGVSLAGALIVPPLLPFVYGEHFQPAVYPFLVLITLNLFLAFHAIATPILRISSQIHIAAYLNFVAIVVGVGLLLGLQEVMRPTLALYIALAAYHVIIALTFIPVVKTLRRATLQQGSNPLH